MSDHQNPDQPLQELATAAQLDEELEQQQQQEQANQQSQQSIIAEQPSIEPEVAPSTSHAEQPAAAGAPDVPATDITTSLGDVGAVVAAAASASNQPEADQSVNDAPQVTSMEVDPPVQKQEGEQPPVVDQSAGTAAPATDAAAQSDIDPSIAAAAVSASQQGVTESTAQQLNDADASMMTQGDSKDDGDVSMTATGTPKPKKERAKPKPRSKSATKITRFRKITSCLQCREKKQKCDRQKPVCGNCRDNPTDDPCHYVDDRKRPGSDDEFAGDSSVGSPLVRKRKQPDDAVFGGNNDHIFKRADFPRVQDRKQAFVAQTRRETVDKLAQVGKDKSRDFNTRVNAARAAAIADVLFESSIILPTAEHVSSLLYTYKTQVEPFVNVVIIDINVARIQSFLRWWHSKPTTMPADPPLVPLLLVVLALTLQARRSSPEYEGHNLRDDAPIPGIECSDERTLLSVAGHCIDALQIACPSAWSSAFQAPIDLTKASLLRGIWHLNELNLQFAGTCFALTTRLAHAAGLHRDPEHWSGMRIEEAQARRNLWWNVVFYEVAHAHRLGQPPSLTHEGFDSRYPDDYDALWAMYERAGLADPDPSRIILPAGTNALVPRVPTRSNFDYHWARFRIYHIFLRQSQQLFRFGISSPPDPNLNDEYAKWREQLPDQFKQHFDRRSQGSVRPSEELLAQIVTQNFDNNVFDPKITEELQDYQQAYNLEFMYHQCMITLHRPYIDEQGAWKPPESVQKSLEVCLLSAEALINTVEDVLAVLPANSMYNYCAYFGFNAGLILAIHCKLDPTSQKHKPQIQKALDLLDTLAGMSRLKNISEQAGRYSSTLKQMLSGLGGDFAALASAKATSGEEGEGAEGEDKPQDDTSREAAILGALDPSLGGEVATASNNGGESRSNADGGPDRIPAFLLPFVGLPSDPNNLGPQPGTSFWSESLLDRPMVGVPVAYPVGFGQSSTETEQNGISSWPPQGAETAPEAAVGEGESHEAGEVPNADAAASAEAYNLYQLLGGRDPGSDNQLPDRPMSFSQHYNHQNPSRDQAASASYRSYVQSSLARTYEQQNGGKTGAEISGKVAGSEGAEGLENGIGSEQMPDESALNAVAAAAAAAASAEAGENKDGLDAQTQGNNLAGMWYAWENFSQMLNNRQ